MKIAYLNARYHKNHTGGGTVHVEQFMRHTFALGHELWAWQENILGVKAIPKDIGGRVRTLRSMDAFYVRIDVTLPSEARWGMPPKRWLYNTRLMVWEFNTHPNYASTRSRGGVSSDTTINTFRKYAPGCDLAICVSDTLADFVRDEIGIKNVLIVPNGSDPDLFYPGREPVPRLQAFADYFNVVWIGSGKEKWHDLDMVKEGAAIITERYPDEKIAFHLIGADLVGVMADMPANLFYWGAQPYRELPGWLSPMDVGLVLYAEGSAEYGSPLKLFDYMASGLCVLSTPSRFMAELSEELDQSGLEVPFGDANRLAEEVMKLYWDQELRTKLSATTRQLVIERYNWINTVTYSLTEIEKILKKRNRTIGNRSNGSSWNSE